MELLIDGAISIHQQTQHTPQNPQTHTETQNTPSSKISLTIMGGGVGGGRGGPMFVSGRGRFLRTLSGTANGSRTFGSSSPSSPTTTTSPTPEKLNSANSRYLSLTSSDSTATAASFYGAPVIPYFSSHPMYEDDYEWVSEDESSSEEDCVLGPVPSFDEVQNAVSALQQVSPVRPELDWKEPSLHLCNPRTLQHSGYDRVYDAFHLLQTDPSVQRMVISLSSDKAVWDAVLKNEVVLELRRAFHAAAKNRLHDADNEPSNSYLAIEFVMWIFNGTKANVRNVMEKITNLMNQLFPPRNNDSGGEAMSAFDSLLNQSYMLCVVVFLIVVVARKQKS